jgi:hypothetical protein
MDLPSIDLAIETLDEEVSDTSSLTDAPRSLMDIDEHSVSSPDSEVSPLKGGFGRFGMSSRFIYDDDDDGFDESDDESAISPGTRSQARVTHNTYFSALENLPVEVSDFFCVISLGI